MRLEIRMPRMSEFSDEGTIAKWRVTVGEIVKKGDVVADIEVDMSTVELTAKADGKVAEIWVHAGQSVPVETVIAMQSVDEGAVVEEETSDEANQPQESVEETASPAPDLSEEFPELGSEPPTEKTEEDDGDAVVQHGHVLATSAAVQLAEQYNVNLETLTGTGSCGRIEREDVEAAMQTSSQFITVEDVDDLMSFDGDFSSKLPSDEPGTAPDEESVQEAATAPAEVSEDDQLVEETATPPEQTTDQTDELPEESIDESVAPQIDHSEGTPEEADNVSADEQADAPSEDIPQEQVDQVSAGLVEDISSEQTDEIAEEDPVTENDEVSVAEEEPAFEEEVEQPDETSSAPDVIYMGAGPETVPADSETQNEALPEEETASAVDGGQPEKETFPDGDEVAGAVEEDPGSGDETMAQEVDSSEQESTLVSAYEPTAEEAEAVVGFSPVSESYNESEALAIDESDTIDSEDMADIESAVEEDLINDEPAPEKLDAATDEEVIEQTGAGASSKSIKVRRIIARKMVESWQNAPHFFVTIAVDMTDVIRFRSDLGVTINDFILAATTRALKEHPWVNCHFVNDEAVEQESVNISLAVETEKGLYYPVVRNCDGKSLKDLGLDAAEMVVKAHSGKLSDDEMEGGTFTISNMGMLGVESFGAIVTPPQVAVLAVGTVKGEVVVDEHEEMIMAPMVRLTLSADHRALDGADAADFLGTIRSYLEAPITLVASQDG